MDEARCSLLDLPCAYQLNNKTLLKCHRHRKYHLLAQSQTQDAYEQLLAANMLNLLQLFQERCLPCGFKCFKKHRKVVACNSYTFE